MPQGVAFPFWPELVSAPLSCARPSAATNGSSKRDPFLRRCPHPNLILNFRCSYHVLAWRPHRSSWREKDYG